MYFHTISLLNGLRLAGAPEFENNVPAYPILYCGNEKTVIGRLSLIPKIGALSAASYSENDPEIVYVAAFFVVATFWSGRKAKPSAPPPVSAWTGEFSSLEAAWDALEKHLARECEPVEETPPAVEPLDSPVDVAPATDIPF